MRNRNARRDNWLLFCIFALISFLLFFVGFFFFLLILRIRTRVLTTLPVNWEHIGYMLREKK